MDVPSAGESAAGSSHRQPSKCLGKEKTAGRDQAPSQGRTGTQGQELEVDHGAVLHEKERTHCSIFHARKKVAFLGSQGSEKRP